MRAPLSLRLAAAATAVAMAGSGSAAQTPGAPVRVVFDTDLGPDADDAGALALLHALADRGEAEILGVACATTGPWCAPAADAIDTYCGRPDIPVGANTGDGPRGGSDAWYGESFNAYLAGHAPNSIRHAEYAEDAVALYRRVLAAAPDTSVTVVAVGPLSNLAHLLASAPDATSPLAGRDLVARKVRLLSVMGGAFPEGTESNLATDAAAAQAVATAWPTPVLFSGFEIGEELATGAALWDTPEANPVRLAYHLWDLHFARRFTPDFDPETGIWPHSSFDQTAVLAAVRAPERYWTLMRGTITVADDGSNTWQADSSGRHAYLVQATPLDELGGLIDGLMAAPPAGR